MRVTRWVLGMLVACCVIAGATPATRSSPTSSATPSAAPSAARPAPKAPKAPSKPKPGAKPPSPEQAQITKLDADLTALQVKQAYLAAVKVARQLYDLQVKVTGKTSVEVERRAQTLASLLSASGDHDGARKIYQEILANAEAKHGKDSREVLNALRMMTGPAWSQNRLDEIDALDRRMLALTKALDGEHSLEYARMLQLYGMVLNSRNEYSAAERVYEQSLQLHEELLPKGDQQLVGPIQILANLYWQTNARPKAVALFDRAIKISEAASGGNPMLVGGTIWGVAAVYHYGKRDDLARPLMQHVIALYDKEIARLEKDKPDDYQLPAMYGMSGFMLREMKDLPAAEQRLQKAIALDEKKSGFSSWTTTLGDIKRAQGKPKEALALYERAQASLTKIAPASATAYNSMIADMLRETGDYKRAEALLVPYLANLEKTFGRRHPIYGQAEFSLAFTHMSSGNIGGAERVLTDSLDLAERELQNVLKTGTESDHAVYFGRYGYQLDSAINFNFGVAPKSGAAARLALTTLLRRKGRALDASAAAMATIRAKLSAEDKKLLDDLATARSKLAKLTVAGPTAVGDDADYTKAVAELEDEVAKLELLIGQKSAAYRVVSQPIELATIQKLVPAGAKLVEIVNFQPADLRKPYTMDTPLDPRRYGAYVLGPTGDPSLVDLGPASDIDQAIEKFRKAVADPDNDRATELGKALDALTFAKLVPLLGSSTEILLAPDGMLNVVPFSALVDDAGAFRIKKYTFTYLTSGRDLLRIKVRTKAQGGGVIFANPNFDAGSPAPATTPTGDVPTSRGRRSADLASLSWPPLPGTGQEAAAVVSTMKGLKLFTGAQATEAQVKAVHGPRILHLATHGFFLPDEVAPPSTGGAPGDNRAGAAAPAAPAGGPTPQVETGENPLLRSGLALAGANKLSSGDDDGILTALEASGLDLEGTKLVVLSACETGAGKATNGDGVYGLRRALVVAGAESLVMSLWQVDDQATKELMVGYYKRLAAGKPRSSALRDIQLELQNQPKYKHPYYWASFLPAGDNSPIKE